MRYAVRSAPPPGAAPMEFVLSDSSRDRVGDVIEQNWDLRAFRANPIALLNHVKDQIIGSWSDVRVEGGRLIGKLRLAAEGTSPLVDTVRKLVEQKILRATSVGFMPIESEKLNEEASEIFGPFRFLKSELLEVSLVAVPANPAAVQLARSMNLPPDLAGAIFCMSKEDHAAGWAVSPAHAPKPDPQRRITSMQINSTLTSRIDAAQKNVVALRDRLNEIVSKEEQDAEEAHRADELPGEIEIAEDTLARLLRQERAIAGARKEGTIVGQNVGGTMLEVAKAPKSELLPPDPRERRPLGISDGKGLEDGDYAFRSFVTMFLAHALREPLETVLRNTYGDRDERMNAVLRAAVNPAMTTTAGNAAELVQTQNAGFLNRILPRSIYLPLANRGVRYTFPSGVSTLKIPVRTTTALLSGAWIGEGNPKPVKKASFASVSLIPYKLAVISTFTEEMALYSNPAIESIIRQALADDTSVSLDTFMIDATAVSSTRPAGLRNGVSGLTATAAGTVTEKMVADIKQLVNAIVANGGGTDIVMIINPAQAITLGFAQTSTGDFLFATVQEAGQKFNVTFIVSQTQTAAQVLAVEASEFATATGDSPRLAISNEATLHEEDTTPLPIGTTGTPNVVAAPVRSLFQTDSVAIRLTLYVTWLMRRTGMVAWIGTVGW